MENLPLIFKRYTSENGGKELLGAVELRLELPGETDVRLGITAITFSNTAWNRTRKLSLIKKSTIS